MNNGPAGLGVTQCHVSAASSEVCTNREGGSWALVGCSTNITRAQCKVAAAGRNRSIRGDVAPSLKRRR